MISRTFSVTCNEAMMKRIENFFRALMFFSQEGTRTRVAVYIDGKYDDGGSSVVCQEIRKSRNANDNLKLINSVAHDVVLCGDKEDFYTIRASGDENNPYWRARDGRLFRNAVEVTDIAELEGRNNEKDTHVPD